MGCINSKKTAIAPKSITSDAPDSIRISKQAETKDLNENHISQIIQEEENVKCKKPPPPPQKVVRPKKEIEEPKEAEETGIQSKLDYKKPASVKPPTKRIAPQTVPVAVSSQDLYHFLREPTSLQQIQFSSIDQNLFDNLYKIVDMKGKLIQPEFLSQEAITLANELQQQRKLVNIQKSSASIMSLIDSDYSFSKILQRFEKVAMFTSLQVHLNQIPQLDQQTLQNIRGMLAIHPKTLEKKDTEFYYSSNVLIITEGRYKRMFDSDKNFYLDHFYESEKRQQKQMFKYIRRLRLQCPAYFNKQNCFLNTGFDIYGIFYMCFYIPDIKCSKKLYQIKDPNMESWRINIDFETEPDFRQLSDNQSLVGSKIQKYCYQKGIKAKSDYFSWSIFNRLYLDNEKDDDGQSSDQLIKAFNSLLQNESFQPITSNELKFYANIMGIKVKDYQIVNDFMYIEVVARSLRDCLLSEIDLTASKGTGLPNQKFLGSSVESIINNFFTQDGSWNDSVNERVQIAKNNIFKNTYISEENYRHDLKFLIIKRTFNMMNIKLTTKFETIVENQKFEPNFLQEIGIVQRKESNLVNEGLFEGLKRVVLSLDKKCAAEIAVNTKKEVILQNQKNIEAYLIIVEKYLEFQPINKQQSSDSTPWNNYQNLMKGAIILKNLEAILESVEQIQALTNVESPFMGRLYLLLAYLRNDSELIQKSLDSLRFNLGSSESFFIKVQTIQMMAFAEKKDFDNAEKVITQIIEALTKKFGKKHQITQYYYQSICLPILNQFQSKSLLIKAEQI